MAFPVIGRCPICNDLLEVTQLHCRHCDTVLDGHYDLGRFYKLSSEQLAFVETFIRCEGKINRVEEELGISYPTVRNRLSEVIRTLGYEVRDDPTPAPTEQRRAILEQLAAGEISSEEAVKLLKVK